MKKDGSSNRNIKKRKSMKSVKLTKSVSLVENINFKSIISQLDSDISKYFVKKIESLNKQKSRAISEKNQELASSINSKLISLYNRLLCDRCHSPTNVLSCATKLCINPKCRMVGISIVAPSNMEDLK